MYSYLPCSQMFLPHFDQIFIQQDLLNLQDSTFIESKLIWCCSQQTWGLTMSIVLDQYWAGTEWMTIRYMWNSQFTGIYIHLSSLILLFIPVVFFLFCPFCILILIFLQFFTVRFSFPLQCFLNFSFLLLQWSFWVYTK